MRRHYKRRGPRRFKNIDVWLEHWRNPRPHRRPERGYDRKNGEERAGRTTEGRGLYKSRSGVIFGVCKGLAEYFNFSVFWTRAAAVALLVFTGLWPIVGIYLLAALLMKPEPAIPFENESDQEFYNSYSSSRSAAVNRVKRTYEQLERRLKRLEDVVTAKEYDWDRRFKEGL